MARSSCLAGTVLAGPQGPFSFAQTGFMGYISHEGKAAVDPTGAQQVLVRPRAATAFYPSVVAAFMSGHRRFLPTIFTKLGAPAVV